VSNAFATVKMRNAASTENDAEKTGALEDEVKVEDGAEIAEVRSTLKPRSPESPDEEEKFRTAIPESVDTRNPRPESFNDKCDSRTDMTSSINTQGPVLKYPIPDIAGSENKKIEFEETSLAESPPGATLNVISDVSDLKHLFATCVVENVALRPLTLSVVELCELAGDGTLHKLEAPIEKVSTTLPASRHKKTSYIPSIALKAPSTESQNAALPRTQNRVVVHGHGTACFAVSWRNR
jgi:hypothetical protein